VPDAETCAARMQLRGEPEGEACQLDLRVEAVGEGLNQAAAEDVGRKRDA
jgi:hypothetical protein